MHEISILLLFFIRGLDLVEFQLDIAKPLMLSLVLLNLSFVLGDSHLDIFEIIRTVTIY